ncbi:uncharacterized protein LOC144164421 isoform X2 [Haemaphysalis longicornis]
MPMTCCVPGCRSGYRSSKEKASLFSLPSDRERRDMWIRAIPRQETGAFSFESKNVRVCEKHFDPADVIRADGFIVHGQAVSLLRHKVKLRDGAMPRVFQDLPARLAKPKPPKPRARSQKVNTPAKRRRVASGATVKSNAEICDADTAGGDDPNGLTQRQKRLGKTAAPSKCISTRTHDSVEPARRQVSLERVSRAASAVGRRQAGLRVSPKKLNGQRSAQTGNAYPGGCEDAAETLLLLCASFGASQERSTLDELFALGQSRAESMNQGIQALQFEASSSKTASHTVPTWTYHPGVDDASCSQETQVGFPAMHRGVQCTLRPLCDAGCQTTFPVSS